MRGSSTKPRQKFQVRNQEKKRNFKKKPQEQTSGLGVTVHGDDINKGIKNL